ncbi:MAG: prenyltransferase [Anaerolineales bacterium]|jgi:1,4-dihydroxy-2-naphthoate octaprenyltransferase
MDKLKLALGPMRPPFLLLTPACVLLGVASAHWTAGQIQWGDALIVLVGALGTHISVNAFNEYFDFKSGLDDRTQRTPFSGGSGTLQAHPEMASTALLTAVVALVVSALVGFYFVIQTGWGLLPLGLLGLVIIYIYTSWLTRFPILTLIAPGLGFGTFMVMGTDYALSGTYTWTSFFASLVPFFLVSNLLLLNQFPDVEADESVGRKHYPITLGRQASGRIYLAFLYLAFVSVIVGVLIRVLPVPALLGLLALVLAIPITRGVLAYAEEIPQLMPSLGQNVIINLIMPVLVAVGLFLG